MVPIYNHTHICFWPEQQQHFFLFLKTLDFTDNITTILVQFDVADCINSGNTLLYPHKVVHNEVLGTTTFRLIETVKHKFKNDAISSEPTVKYYYLFGLKYTVHSILYVGGSYVVLGPC